MTTELIAPPTTLLHRGRRADEGDRDQATEEAQHDALQAVGTILALLEAGKLTVDDARVTSTRLAQIEDEVVCLRSVLRDAIPVGSVLVAAPPPPDVADVADETARLVSAVTVGWTGTAGVVADTSARTTVTPPELRRILRNVLRNAVRAAGPGGQVRVTVSPGAGQVHIEVEDDGPGFGGLAVRHGIGLRSVRRLVRDAGGSFESRGRSRLGGASVRIHLPGVESEAAS